MPAAATPLPPDFRRQTSMRRRLVHVQPSKRPETNERAGLLFAPAAQDRLDLGTAIHELFKEVSWVHEVDVDDLIAEWSASSPTREELKEKAIDVFSRAMGAPEIRRALTRPPGDVSLWRERKFEIVIGNRWLSGAFDRVVVLHDQSRKVLKATVLDFKSDEVPDEAAVSDLARQYRPQMDHYRSAVSRMLGLQPAKVALELLFVQSGKAYELR